jgi:hypothetical protein
MRSRQTKVAHEYRRSAGRSADPQGQQGREGSWQYNQSASPRIGPHVMHACAKRGQKRKRDQGSAYSTGMKHSRRNLSGLQEVEGPLLL